MKNKSLLAIIAVLSLMVAVSLTAYTQVDSVYAVSVEERIAKLTTQIQAHADRITALESKKNGTNDVSIDVRIDMIQQQITDKQALIDSLRAVPTVDRAVQIIKIQNQLNDAINEINRLTTIILQLQTSLHSLIVLDSTPVTVSEPVEINEFESYIIVNGTEFGLGDTVGITVKFNRNLHVDIPVNLRGETGGYTERYEIEGDDELCYSKFVNGTIIAILEGDAPNCEFNADGSVFTTWLLSGDLLAREYHVHASHRISWDNGGRNGESVYSSPILLR